MSRATLFILAVVGLVIVRAALAVATWEQGWSALTWDDFTRVLIANEWAADPYLYRGLVWLPLPVWITGSVFAIFGGSFSDNPMALMAIVNTAAVYGASLTVAWTAWKIFRSHAGTLVAFAAALFAPWGLFLGGSGLAEPLTFLAVSVVAAAAVAWLQGRRTWVLAIGSVAVAAATAMRYEAWWLAAAWLASVALLLWIERGERSVLGAIREGWVVLLVAVAPLAIPAAWMLVNQIDAGSPVYFARESARIFSSAYGSDLFDSIPERLLYYPASLLRAAPLAVVAIAAVALARWQRIEVRGLVVLFGLQFGMFYATSLLSPAVGAFPERFMFAFAIGLAPILGGIPETLRGFVPKRALVPLAVVLVVVAIAVTAVRLNDPPQEWTHPPDLLLLTESIDDLDTEEIALVLGDGMANDAIPLDVQSGDRTGLIAGSGSPESPGPEVGLWVERLPAHPGALEAAGVVVGRYHLYGPLARAMSVEPCAGCTGWVFVDEANNLRPADAGGFLALEFVSDDPLPGDRASLVRDIELGQEAQTGVIDLRWLYGHGFNAGRMEVEVSLDGATIWKTDVAAPSRWTKVAFDLPAGPGTAELKVSVVALPGIEQGWAWGRASTVLVRELEIQ